MNAHGRPVVKRRVEELRENPHQHELFDDLSDAQLVELAADMDANGQREPIEITGDNTIIDGHQRRRAAEKLDWTEVDVVVRHDLEFEGEKAIERHMIDVNLNRRQLDPLAIARLYKRLKQMEQDWDRDEFSPWGRGELRDRLAKRLGTRSGRTLDRYLKLLDAPLAVQRCVSRGELPMQAALKVLRLTFQQQEALAAAIEAGEPAKEAVAAHFPRTQASRNSGTPMNNSAQLSANEPATSSMAQEQTVDGLDDMGELQGVVDALRSAIEDVVRSDVSTARKTDVIVQATVLFDVLLDEAEAEQV